MTLAPLAIPEATVDNSTADLFCKVYANLKSIEPTLDEPMRHQMRAMRDAGIRLINNALVQAESIYFAAIDLPDACRAAVDDALAEIPATQAPEAVGKGGA